MDDSYVKFLLRWWWLIVIGTIVALGVTTYTMRNQPVLYSSTATVEVGRTIQDTKPSQSELDVITQLVPAYTEIAKRPPLLNKTIETLHLPFTTDQLQSMTLISQVAHAPLIDVTVVDTDPKRAAAIASEIARQIVLQSPSPSQEDDATQAFIQSQLTDLKKKISDGQNSIQSIQDQIARLTSASDISDAQRQLDVLNQQVNSWQESYASLLQSVQPTNTNMVTLVNPGEIPTSPMSRPRIMYYGLGVAVGAGLSVVIALLLDLFWPSLRTPKDLEPGSPGSPIVSVPRFRAKPQEMHIVVANPTARAASAYRQLRNVLGSGKEIFVHRLAVISSRSGEGKTTTASNLAISIGASGLRVLLVDANLRNPELAERFELAHAPGLSELLKRTATCAQVVQQTNYKNVAVVTAGRLRSDYADLLSNQYLGLAIDELSAVSDVVIFDCPAILEENEPLLLLRHVDGAVAVVEMHGTKPDMYRELLATLDTSGITVAAIVGNKASPSSFRLGWVPWSRSSSRRRRAAERRLRHSEGLEPAPARAASGDPARNHLA